MAVFKAIPAELFADLKGFMGKSDPRPYLNGLNVTLTKDGVLTAQASDGTKFMENRLQASFFEGECSFILCGSSLETLKRMNRYTTLCLFVFDEDTHQLTIDDRHYNLVLEGKYPDYERIFASTWQPAGWSVKRLRDLIRDGGSDETGCDDWITANKKTVGKILRVASKRKNTTLWVTKAMQTIIKVEGEGFRILVTGVF